MIDTIVLKHLDALKLDIQNELSSKGINNTNKASNSLKSQKVSDTEFNLVALEYLEFLNKGRGGSSKVPSKMPPVDDIQDWVKSKLGITGEKESLSAAYAVAKKIKAKGTNIFISNSKGIVLESLILKMKKNLTEEISTFAVTRITQRLNKFAKARKKQ